MPRSPLCVLTRRIPRRPSTVRDAQSGTRLWASIPGAAPMPTDGRDAQIPVAVTHRQLNRVRQERDTTCSSLEDRELRGSALSLRSRRSEEFTHGAQGGGRRGRGKTHRHTHFFIQPHYRVVTTLCPNQLSGPAHFRYFSLRYSI